MSWVLGLSQNRELEQEWNEDQPHVREKTRVPLDIMKEVYKSNFPEFSGKEGGQAMEAWLVGVKRDISFKDYTSNEKSQIAMIILKED